jgi:MFS family permease
VNPNGWHWRSVALGFAFLICSSFLDNLRGPLLPQISRSLGLDFSQSSLFISTGNLSSVGATLLIAVLSRRIPVVRLGTPVLIFGALSCLFVAFVVNRPTLTIFAAIIGISITVLGSLSSIYVIEGTPILLRSRMLAGLHSLYGLGSLVAALAVAAQLKLGWSWQVLFMGCAALLAAILAGASQSRKASRNTPQMSARPDRAFKLVDLAYCVPIVLYVLGEVGTSTWLVTYVVRAQGVGEAFGSVLLSGFFGCLAGSRVLTMFLCRPGSEWKWSIVSLGFATVFFYLGLTLSPYFFPLVGILGPFFPLYIQFFSVKFPGYWQTIALLTFSIQQAALAAFHYGMGWMVDHQGASVAYVIPGLCLVLSFVTLLRVRQ